MLWIVLDTVRADHLSVYGYPRNTSPNLVELAADGVTFENAVAQSSWTIPSHFQMVTSKVVAGLARHLNPEFVTVAEILKENGYETAAVLANPLLGRLSGFGQGFDTFIDLPVMIFYLDQLFKKIPNNSYTIRLCQLR